MKRLVPGREKRPAIFLDRDGTIIEDVDYLSRIEDIRPIAGVSHALRRLGAAGYVLVLVTNQSGVARGFFDEEFVRETHRVLEQMLEFSFDGIYFCPHGPDASCNCRKPRTGMVETAVRELGLRRGGSYVIGDKPGDMELAIDAGMEGVLVLTGQGKQHRDSTRAPSERYALWASRSRHARSPPWVEPAAPRRARASFPMSGSFSGLSP